jgi:hypothetical protein
MRKGYFSAVGASVGIFLAVCLAADYGLPEAKAECVTFEGTKCTNPLWCSSQGQCNACRAGNGDLRWSLYGWVQAYGNDCVDGNLACGWCNDVVCGSGSTFWDSNCTQVAPTSNCYMNGCRHPQ